MTCIYLKFRKYYLGVFKNVEFKELKHSFYQNVKFWKFIMDVNPFSLFLTLLNIFLIQIFFFNTKNRKK